MQITLFSGPADLLPARGARNVAHSRSKRRKNRIEPFNHLGLAADHHAVASFQTEDAPAGAHIHIVNLPRRDFLRTTDVIHVIGIAAVDKDVARLEMRQNIGDGLVDDCSRHHQPDCSRLFEFLHEFRQRGSALRLLLDQLVDRVWRPVEHHAVVTLTHEPPHHVGAHSSKTDHAQLHRCLLRKDIAAAPAALMQFP